MMKKTIISSDALGESYYCYRHTSGLEVALYPMPQFSSVYALFGTRYGSIDNTLCEPDGTKTEGRGEIEIFPGPLAKKL